MHAQTHANEGRHFWEIVHDESEGVGRQPPRCSRRFISSPRLVLTSVVNTNGARLARILRRLFYARRVKWFWNSCGLREGRLVGG